MIFKQKFHIRFNIFIRNVLFHLIFWESGLLFYVFLTGDNQIFKIYSSFLKVNSNYIVVVVGAITAILFTILDIVFSYRVVRVFPIRFTVFFKSLLYFASVYFIIIIISQSSITVFRSKSYKELLNELPLTDIYFLRFVVYFYMACFFNSFLKGMIKKVGRGNFKNWIIGMMNKPREEERIFMFIDMKSSTTIAEKLNHKKFSYLVQDVFNDIAIVDNYKGEIYQYLGDGAIISWSLRNGIKHNNCLKSFYAFTNLISKRKNYYMRRYGLVPSFKAGLHVGKVMVLQVGQIRKDISYNGDTINTTARIESVCNEYKKNLLISGDLYNLLDYENDFSIKIVENVKLKGKKKGVDIYFVKQK